MDRWIVRVGEKEYGPVERATLDDWRGEGRLLPTNQVRREDEEMWLAAAEVPGLFEPPPLPEKTSASARELPPRTLVQLIGESLRLYRRAFVPFFVSTLLVALPMLLLNLTSNSFGIFPSNDKGGISSGSLVALLAFTWLVVAWPIYLASVQLAAADVRAGEKIRLLSLWRRAVNFFPRMAMLSVIVYGSYFFWAVLPLVALASLAGGPSILGIFLALLLVAAQIFMLARLFVNFMFWQQVAVISGKDGSLAVRESKILARSQRRARPLWRGVALASVWGALVLAISTFADLPWALPHFRELATPEQVFAFLQKMNAGPHQLEPLLIAGAIVSSLLQALLRPVVGIAFVLLYFDTRADFSEHELDESEL